MHIVANDEGAGKTKTKLQFTLGGGGGGGEVGVGADEQRTVSHQFLFVCF